MDARGAGLSFTGDVDLNQQLFSNQDYECFLKNIVDISPKIYVVIFDPGKITDFFTCDSSRILYSKQYGWSLIEEMAMISCADIFIGTSNIYGAAAKQFGSPGMIFFEEENNWYDLQNTNNKLYKKGIKFNKEELKETICSYIRY